MEFTLTVRNIISSCISSHSIPSHPQLVPGSGHGWQLFRVEARDGTGEKSKAKKGNPEEALEELHGKKSEARTINLEEFTGNVREENEREEVSKGSARVELRAVKELDYENPDHRQGFRFRLQVTDKVSDMFYTRIILLTSMLNISVYLSVYSSICLSQSVYIYFFLSSFFFYDRSIHRSTKETSYITETFAHCFLHPSP